MGESKDKPLVWLHGEVKTPPFSKLARLRRVSTSQIAKGDLIGMPHLANAEYKSCHELRIADEKVRWRLMYKIDSD